MTATKSSQQQPAATKQRSSTAKAAIFSCCTGGKLCREEEEQEQQQQPGSTESVISVSRQSARDHPCQQQQVCCWICLEESGKLEVPCQCVTRPVHVRCLARWQLQAAGKREENMCRFCHQQLPDWRTTLAPSHPVEKIQPVMAINFEGKTYKLRVQPGPEGLALFQEQVRQLIGFKITHGCDVEFECKACTRDHVWHGEVTQCNLPPEGMHLETMPAPVTGETLHLGGIASYNAAIHCATIAAAERKKQRSAEQATARAPPSEGTSRGRSTPGAI